RMADTIALYLDNTGRVRDRTNFTTWVQKHMVGADGPTLWAMERQHAWVLSVTGREAEAVELLQRQLEAIERAGGEIWQRATSQNLLGKVWTNDRQSRRALEILGKAFASFEAGAAERLSCASMRPRFAGLHLRSPGPGWAAIDGRLHMSSSA